MFTENGGAWILAESSLLVRPLPPHGGEKVCYCSTTRPAVIGGDTCRLTNIQY